MNDPQSPLGTEHRIGNNCSPADILEAARPLIELAIAEDIGPGDATSEAVLPSDLTLHGRISAKGTGVIAGLPVPRRSFPAWTAHPGWVTWSG